MMVKIAQELFAVLQSFKCVQQNNKRESNYSYNGSQRGSGRDLMVISMLPKPFLCSSEQTNIYRLGTPL